MISSFRIISDGPHRINRTTTLPEQGLFVLEAHESNTAIEFGSQQVPGEMLLEGFNLLEEMPQQPCDTCGNSMPDQ
jgi:hypothetical protein